MTPTTGPFAVVARVTALLDDLEVPYALGGSLASSLLGEPRSTIDVDIAISIDPTKVDRLIEAATVDFFLPSDFARAAVARHQSFNLLERSGAMKVDLFALGDGLLDRNQLARRVHVMPPGLEPGIWVTSPEDQILRKLDWFRRGEGTSDRQWRDVLGLLRARRGRLDLDYLTTTADAADLRQMLDDAFKASLD